MHLAANTGSIAAHPHQVVLQWLAEWGWPATLCAVLLFGIGMTYALNLLRFRKGVGLDAALWLSISGALVLAQVSGVFVMPYVETWLSVLIGLAISCYRKELKVKNNSSYKIQIGVWRLLSVPAILVLAQVLITQVPTLQKDVGDFLEEHETGKHPRFWVQGWIPMND
jgi:ABC-type phosphate transport system permease subunit